MSRPAMTPMALEWEQRQDGFRARKVRAFIDFGIRIDPEVLDHDESQIHVLRIRSRWSWWWRAAAPWQHWCIHRGRCPTPDGCATARTCHIERR